MLEKKKVQEKELLFFHKSLLEAASRFREDIERHESLSAQDKLQLKRLVSEKKGIEEAESHARLDQIRQLKSFKDFQIFLQSEKIKKIEPGMDETNLSELEGRIGEIGRHANDRRAARTNSPEKGRVEGQRRGNRAESRLGGAGNGGAGRNQQNGDAHPVQLLRLHGQEHAVPAEPRRPRKGRNGSIPN